MDEFVLFGHQRSGSAAIEIALSLAQRPYRVVAAATWDASSDLDALRRVNPLQQIPALVWPGGEVMTESAAILVELGLRDPGTGLLPHEPTARAQAIRGLVFIAANCYSAIGIIDYPARFCSPCEDAIAEQIRSGTRARLHAMWSTFADQFSLDGQRPGALEALAVVVSRWCGTREHLAAARPSFLQTLLAIEAHPRVAPVLARHWEAAAAA